MKNLKTLINRIHQILWAYQRIIFKNPKVEEIADIRRDIIDLKCKCTKYYINFKIFGFNIKLFPYCKFCGCYKEAKIRDPQSHCPIGNWKEYELNKIGEIKK